MCLLLPCTCTEPRVDVCLQIADFGLSKDKSLDHAQQTVMMVRAFPEARRAPIAGSPLPCPQMRVCGVLTTGVCAADGLRLDALDGP